MGKTKYDTSIFIKKAQKIHEDKYDYSLVSYVNSKTKIKILCLKHGEFEQIPSKHLQGQGCSKCANEKLSKIKLKSTVDFLEKLGDNKKYDYSKTKYEGRFKKVIIICPKHGEFKQTPDNHLNGKGCPRCANEKRKYNTIIFIQKAKKIHGNRYDYSISNYSGSNIKISIICKKHGIFKQKPSSHINHKQGCPYCNESKGEKEIRNYLVKNKIVFERQKKFDNCRGKKKSLPFDFYLPKKNLLIEYDGKQHYINNEYFGGKKEFQARQLNDKIKSNFAKDNNIKLLRITYKDDILKKLISNL